MDGKLLSRNIRGKGRFWLNQPKRILAKDRLRWGVRVEEFGQIPMVIRYQGWEISAKLT